jgi:hypothetical protein
MQETIFNKIKLEVLKITFGSFIHDDFQEFQVLQF